MHVPVVFMCVCVCEHVCPWVWCFCQGAREQHLAQPVLSLTGRAALQLSSGFIGILQAALPGRTAPTESRESQPPPQCWLLKAPMTCSVPLTCAVPTPNPTEHPAPTPGMLPLSGLRKGEWEGRKERNQESETKMAPGPILLGNLHVCPDSGMPGPTLTPWNKPPQIGHMSAHGAPQTF